ncbi:MAG: sugar ABC transporter permease [Peptostreptococcaceae bacterium]|nr:sugar ABC transporter permease [Peptostreptococcaceae bacterium]
MTRKIKYKDTPYAWAMIMPNLLLFIVFMLFPLVWTLVLSLNKYDMITPMKFIGLKNYVDMFKDPIAMECLSNTLVFTILTVPASMVISLYLAVLLDTNVGGKRFYRGAYFIPSITSWVVISVIWQWLYNDDFGLFNYLLSFFQLGPIKWLTSSKLSLLSIVLVSIWKSIGYNMLLFLAGLQSISNVYYEAADLDGVTRWQKFKYITLPLLSPTTFFVFIISIISSFQVFDIVVLMTKGGPARSSSVLVHYLYQNAFSYFKMGYASAIAYLLFIIIMIITMFNLHFEKKSREIF